MPIAQLIKSVDFGTATKSLQEAGVKTGKSRFRDALSIQGPLPTALREGPASPKATTREQAIYEGFNKYTDETGQQRTIRQYGSKYHPLGSAETTAKRKVNRGQAERIRREQQQTIGEDTFHDSATSRHPHHRAGIRQLQPWYEGLTDVESKQLSKKFKQFGIEPGAKRENRLDLPDNVHTALHNWERHNHMQFPMDYFANKSFAERMEAVQTYAETIQRAYDEAAYGLMRYKHLPTERLTQMAIIHF